MEAIKFEQKQPRLTFVAGGVQLAEIEVDPPPGQAIRCALPPKLVKALRRRQSKGQKIHVILETRESREAAGGQALAMWLDANLPGELKETETPTTTAIRVLSITERGTTLGYRNLVVDFRSLVVMRALGVPVVFDGTHSTQRPGGLGHASGGDREMIPTLVRAAIAAGCDALFLETHEDPPRARCDAATQLPLDRLESLLAEVRRIRDAVGAN